LHFPTKGPACLEYNQQTQNQSQVRAVDARDVRTPRLCELVLLFPRRNHPVFGRQCWQNNLLELQLNPGGHLF